MSNRPTAAQRGYGARWQRVRAAYLRRNPLCVLCQRVGQVRTATVVDHITPHKGDQALMWDPANFQALCKDHHDLKTASEDGAFGNPRKVRGCGADGLPLDPDHPWNRGGSG